MNACKRSSSPACTARQSSTAASRIASGSSTTPGCRVPVSPRTSTYQSPPPAPAYVFSAPSPNFGCFPDPEFLAIGKGSDGKSYLFSGNAGTEDVSVMDLERARSGV